MKRTANQTESPDVVVEPLTAEPVPIALVALELGEHIEVLAARLRAEVFADPTTGLRCVDASTCKRLIDEANASAAWRAKAMIEAEAKIRAMNTPPPGRVDKHTEELAFHGSKLGGLR